MVLSLLSLTADSCLACWFYDKSLRMLSLEWMIVKICLAFLFLPMTALMVLFELRATDCMDNLFNPLVFTGWIILIIGWCFTMCPGILIISSEQNSFEKRPMNQGPKDLLTTKESEIL